jgi:hypothetical protein
MIRFDWASLRTSSVPASHRPNQHAKSMFLQKPFYDPLHSNHWNCGNIISHQTVSGLRALVLWSMRMIAGHSTRMVLVLTSTLWSGHDFLRPDASGGMDVQGPTARFFLEVSGLYGDTGPGPGITFQFMLPSDVRAYKALLCSPRWQRVYNLGGRPQRLLWASTGTKDPKSFRHS